MTWQAGAADSYGHNPVNRQTLSTAAAPRRALAAVLATLAAVVGGCGSAGNPASAGTPVDAADGLPSGYRSMSCADPTAGVEKIDVTSISLRHPTRTHPVLTAEFRFAHDPPLHAGLLELALGLFSRLGTPRDVLAARLGEGAPGLLLYDPDTGQETRLAGAPTVSGDTVTANFPVEPDVLAGQQWQWRATVEVNGSSTDECPT
jgi:hypothetical protein